MITVAALIGQRDVQAASQEGRFAQALLERVEVEVQDLEDLAVGPEGDRGAGGVALLERLALHQRPLRGAARVLLRPAMPVAADLDREVLRERVDDGDADAVQAARHLVAAAVAELSAGVQHREHDLDRRPALLLHHRHRDAAAVVGLGHRVVGVDRHGDRRGEAGERFVDRVVDELVDEVVQSALARRADVHAGAQPDRLEALQHGDVLGVVVGRSACALVSQTSSKYVAKPRSAAQPRRSGAHEIRLQNNSTQGSRAGAVRGDKSPANQLFPGSCARSAEQRIEVSAAMPSRAARAASRSGARSSNSAAQTASSQATRRTPPRTETGLQ